MQAFVTVVTAFTVFTNACYLVYICLRRQVFSKIFLCFLYNIVHFPYFIFNYFKNVLLQLASKIIKFLHLSKSIYFLPKTFFKFFSIVYEEQKILYGFV